MAYLNELEKIAEHFQDVDAAIREFFAQILGGDFHNRPQWVGERIEDVEKLLELRLLENDRAVSLMILAALEAWFRVDCRIRAENREETRVGRLFAEIYAAVGQSVSKIRFGKILEAWLEAEPESEPIISHVRSVFNYRHWLAHGRYWELKSGRVYDYETVYVIARDAAVLLDAFVPRRPLD